MDAVSPNGFTHWLRHPLAPVRRRFQAWFQSRLPLRDSITLTQRNVYILPTRPGFMLGFTLLLLLVASINYQLNLGYLMTFLLAGAAVVGMHIGHGTLRGTTMNLSSPAPQFAGGTVLIPVQLINSRRSVRHGIGLSVLGSEHWAWTDVPALGSASVQVACQALQRGVHRLPALTAETRFPLGTFRVWTVWRPAAEMVIYPAPEPHAPPLPPGEPRSSGVTVTQLSQRGEFDGVRVYRRGDPLRLVVWKKAARALAGGGGELVSRDTQQAQRYELWLDFKQTGLAPTEARLSRLCAWVLQAERLGLDYGLRLPGVEISPGSGAAQQRQCLEALARC